MEYSPKFVDKYLKLVWACAEKDRKSILKVSRDLGFLCGRESPAMVSAHVEAAYIMGEPFAKQENSESDNSTNVFDFGAFDHGKRMAEQASIFANQRLVPPPTEVYTLHRKLFGAISTCVKLKSRFDCRSFLQHHMTLSGIPSSS